MSTTPPPIPPSLSRSATLSLNDKRLWLICSLVLLGGVAIGFGMAIVFVGPDRQLEAEQKKLVQIQLKQIEDAKAEAERQASKERAELAENVRKEEDERRRRALAHEEESKAHDAEYVENQRLKKKARERDEDLMAASKEIARLDGLRASGAITQEQYDEMIKKPRELNKKWGFR